MGNWTWSDADVLTKYLQPWVTYKSPDDTTKAFVYKEYLCAVLGQYSPTPNLSELLVKTILLMPDPDSSTGYLFPTVFSDTATTPLYTIPAEGEKATDALLKRAVDTYMEVWTPPPSAPKDLHKRKDKRSVKCTVTVGPPGQQASAPELDPAECATMDEQATVFTSTQQVTAQARAAAKAKKEIQTLVDKISKNPPTTATRSAQKMLSFMALVCSRLCVKTVDQVTLYFQMKASSAFRGTCKPSALAIKVPVPERNFLKQLKTSFVKGCPEQRKIHEYLVGALMFYTDVGLQGEASRRTKHKVGILSAGCLTHLSGNGLGFVALLLAASKATGADPKCLLEYAIDTTVAGSGQLLMDFLLRYHAEKPEYSWQWSRLVNDNNFRSLSLRDNRWLGSRFAALLEVTQGDERIWKKHALGHVPYIMRKEAMEWVQGFLQHCESVRGQQKSSFQKVVNTSTQAASNYCAPGSFTILSHPLLHL